MTAANLEQQAITRFVAGTMVDDHERATLAEALLRTLVAGPYAAGADRSALRELFEGVNPSLLARLLEDQPPNCPYARLAAFVAHVMRVGAALLRLGTDTESMAVLLPHLVRSAAALPDGVDPRAACAHIVGLAHQMQRSALAGDIELAYQQATVGARLVRLCASQMPGTFGALRDLIDTDLTVADVAEVRKDYGALATQVVLPS